MGDRLMRLAEVERITGLSRSTIYRKIEDGTFPPPVRPNPGMSRWRKSDIDDWMESLPVAGGPASDVTSGGDGQRPWRGRPKTQRGARLAPITSRGISANPKRRQPHGTSPDRLRSAPRRILIPVASTHAGMLPVPDQPWASAWPSTGSDDAHVRLREVVRP